MYALKTVPVSMKAKIMQYIPINTDKNQSYCPDIVVEEQQGQMRSNGCIDDKKRQRFYKERKKFQNKNLRKQR